MFRLSVGVYAKWYARWQNPRRDEAVLRSATAIKSLLYTSAQSFPEQTIQIGSESPWPRGQEEDLRCCQLKGRS
jgi:hypothetical protein